MKVISLRHLFSNLIDSTTIRHLHRDFLQNNKTLNTSWYIKQKVNIYIDGLSFIFAYSGHLNNFETSFLDLNNYLLAKYCMEQLTLLITDWSRYVRINNVIMLFDSKVPDIKQKKNSDKNNYVEFSLKKVKKLIMEVNKKELKTFNFIARNTIFGEADCGLLFEHDTNLPSILITNDADVILISLGYRSLHVHDKIAVYLLNKKQFYLPANIKCNLSKDVLQLLLILLGTDYSPRLLYLDAYHKIIKYKLYFKIQCRNDLIFVLSKFYRILEKYSYPCSYINSYNYNNNKGNGINIKTYSYSQSNNCEQLIDLIYWTFIYLTTGKFKNIKFNIKPLSASTFFNYCHYTQFKMRRSRKKI